MHEFEDVDVDGFGVIQHAFLAHPMRELVHDTELNHERR